MDVLIILGLIVAALVILFAFKQSGPKRDVTIVRSEWREADPKNTYTDPPEPT